MLIVKISYRFERLKVGNDFKYIVILRIVYMFINCIN